MYVLVNAITVGLGFAWGMTAWLIWPGMTFWLVAGFVRALVAALEAP